MLLALVVVGGLGAGCGAAVDPAPRVPTPVASSGGTSVAYEDVSFVQMMLAHDRQTVQICDLLLAKDGVDPAVRTLAAQMRTAREPEITRLASWLSGWGVDESPLEHEHAGRTHGLLRPGQLATFARAGGPAAQEAFLATMLSHDRAAQEIATTVLAEGSDAGVQRLAQTALATARTEIGELERLLRR